MVKRRINIVLDLDNTLISAIDDIEEDSIPISRLLFLQKNLLWENMEDEFKVFSRPYLQEFLTWLFKNFNVSVWTAASKSYALFVIHKFVLADKPERKLDYVLFSHHCTESKKNHKAQKSLAMMDTVFPIGYFIDDTYIIDDNKEVYNTQPDMCIRIKPFDVLKENCELDEELLLIQKKLNKIKT